MLEQVTPEQQSLTTAIIDFVMTEEPCDIDILRRALYCQVLILDNTVTQYLNISQSILYKYKSIMFCYIFLTTNKRYVALKIQSNLFLIFYILIDIN